MERNELLCLGLVGIGGMVIGNIINRCRLNKQHTEAEILLSRSLDQSKELISIAKKAQTENKILRAKMKEMGCL